MALLFHRIQSYLSYWLNAVGEHSLQGPFIYDLFKKVIGRSVNHECHEILQVRDEFSQNKSSVSLNGFGAGSSYLSSDIRMVRDIVKKGAIEHRFGVLLYRLIDYTDSKRILELGTSLGLSTLYLSKNNEVKVTTIEGEPDLAKIASSVFDEFGRKNIMLINEDIDKALPEYLQENESVDFVFFDANHTEEATLEYFNQCLKKKHDETCFVFDDIHWSPGMASAWQQIQQHFEVTLSVDLYQMGIVFFNPEIRKQHFILEL